MWLRGNDGFRVVTQQILWHPTGFPFHRPPIPASVSFCFADTTGMPFINMSRQRIVRTLTRQVALVWGGFGLFNLAAASWANRFDGNLLWIDLRWMPAPLATLLLTAACAAMAAFACRPDMSPVRRRITLMLMGALTVITAFNAITCIAIDSRGQAELAHAVPFSAVVTSLLIGLMLGKRAAATEQSVRRESNCKTIYAKLCTCLTGGAVLTAFVVGLPLSQMIWFGQSDYRRSADAAVVFGARAYADGTLSDVLEDRVRTACELYEQGVVKELIFSGGPGDGDIYEAQAMQHFAVARGIPVDDTHLDLLGLNTRATVQNTTPLFRQHRFNRVLVVSHDYHLPRIKMAYQQHGVETYTVPARQRYRLRAEPYYMAREVAAWWGYFLRRK